MIDKLVKLYNKISCFLGIHEWTNGVDCKHCDYTNYFWFD